MTIKPLADICFEVSFESGNKVGGIHTVLVSKSEEMKKYYNKNYYTIGFFNPKNYFKEFEEKEIPKEIENVFKKLEKEGIKCHWGKWIVAEDVNLILIDPREFMNKKVNGEKNIHVIKGRLWDKFKIDSLRSGFDFDEPIAWSTAAGILIEELIKNVKEFKNKKIVVHCHEWLSGGTILYLVEKKVPVGLVFTTHATRVGRAKSGAGEDLIKEIENGLKSNLTMDDKEAYKYYLEGQHFVEKNCAKYAHVFTTVSDVVGREAEYVLGKKPDIITLNGLDFSRFPSISALAILHEKIRKRINNFLKAYFSPHYPIKLKNSSIFFISGRYEFYNKGVDLYIQALSLLNEKLKKENSQKTVFAFILIPYETEGPREDLLESIIQYQNIEDLLDDEILNIKQDIIDLIINGKKLCLNEIVSEDFKIKTKIISNFFNKFRSNEAPLSAFELKGDNEITNYLKKYNLLNKKDDKVKIIYYPTYLSVTDGVLGMSYTEFVIGSSMGIFPSRYEPWGYTPFETAVLRTLSVTTDVAGFGAALINIIKNKEDLSKRVLNIKGRKPEDIAKDLANIMEWCVKLPRDEKILEKAKSRQFVEMFDWKHQISNYIKAHNLAIKKAYKLK